MSGLRGRRHRRRSSGPNHLALIPFIDMMTILVVFLLVHTADVDILPNTKNIVMPQSISELKPRATVVVMVTRYAVLVNGRTVVPLATLNAMPDSETIIQPLKLELASQADRVLRNAARDDQAAREITIMGDKDLPFRILKKVMATCTDANYGKVSLAVVEAERAQGKG
jgi:biopolymer transport protein ExbD